MATKLGARCTYVIVFASFLAFAIPTVACAEIIVTNVPTSALPSAVAPETCCTADSTVYLPLGIASTLTIKKSFKTYLTGDDKVLQVVPFEQSDRTVIVSPLTRGVTNILFFDQESLPIFNVRIVVVEASAHTIRMFVHDQGKLANYLVYRCDNHGCEERKGGAKEDVPEPLPRGYSNTTGNSTVNSTNLNHNLNHNEP